MTSGSTSRKAKAQAAGGTSRKAKAQAAAPKQGPSKSIIAGVVAAVVIIGIVVAVIIGASGGKSSGQAVAPRTATGQSGGIVANPTTAKPGAPTLELYEDFQCPICGELEKSFGAQITSMAQAGQIKLVYHMLSFLDVNLSNDSSARAADAAACADDAGRFLQYHAAVYAGQPTKEGQGYTDAQLAQFATQAGISGSALDTWKKCYADKKYEQYVTNVQEAGTKAGVNATPTIKLNGKDLDLSKLTPQYLTEQVKAATK